MGQINISRPALGAAGMNDGDIEEIIARLGALFQRVRPFANEPHEFAWLCKQVREDLRCLIAEFGVSPVDAAIAVLQTRLNVSTALH
jgi:hypothetical protein